MAMLLTDNSIPSVAKNYIKSNTLKYLKENKVTKVIIVGGKETVSNSVVKQITSYLNNDEVANPTVPVKSTYLLNQLIQIII